MKPCFGLSLQTGVEIIAWTEILNGCVVVIHHTCQWRPENIIFIFLDLGALIMGGVLAKGAMERSASKCKAWIIFTVFHALGLLGLILRNTLALEEYPPAELFVVCGYLTVYKPYALWVVVEIVNEIRRCGGLNQTLVNLTDREVEEFLYGTLEEKFSNPSRDRRESLSTTAILAPYDRNYEINLTDFHFDKANLLGSGKYGKIYKGKLLRIPNRAPEIETEIAIKTLQADSDTAYFKALLSELKIMICLGEHPSIVRLIGACTLEIQKKNLWIVLELCELGSLKSYLDSAQGFTNVAEQQHANHEHDGPSGSAGNCCNQIQLEDAHRWSLEIAQGLEYMEQQNIIHGDLAARNILLTLERHAKVSDFGLSRKLLQYSTKSQKMEDLPLPWRWMAIESLDRLEFSSKSDVWSYGVTLWEIFTLGNIPYSASTWNLGFVKQLVQGSRLSQPVYDTSEMYKIILSCWTTMPAQRPTFSQLLQTLKKLFDHRNNLQQCISESEKLIINIGEPENPSLEDASI